MKIVSTNNPFVRNVLTWRVERHVARKSELADGFFMSPSEAVQYIHDKNFQRNESVWVLKTIDHKPPQDIATLFNISAEEVDLIAQKHQEYWDEQTKNNHL